MPKAPPSGGLRPEDEAEIRTQIAVLKKLGIDTSELERAIQPTLFDLPPVEPPKPAPIPIPIPKPAPKPTFERSENPAQDGPPDLPAGFRLLQDERVRICPKCGQWAVAQERAPTERVPKVHVVYSHGVQGRVTGYREIIAVYHCTVEGRLP